SVVQRTRQSWKVDAWKPTRSVHSTRNGNYYPLDCPPPTAANHLFSLTFEFGARDAYQGGVSNEKEYLTVKTLSPNLLLIGALGLVISISGCATKKFVRTTVDPVQTKVNEVDQRTTQNTE